MGQRSIRADSGRGLFECMAAACEQNFRPLVIPNHCERERVETIGAGIRQLESGFHEATGKTGPGKVHDRGV